jgi:hypothetical protein
VSIQQGSVIWVAKARAKESPSKTWGAFVLPYFLRSNYEALRKQIKNVGRKHTALQDCLSKGQVREIRKSVQGWLETNREGKRKMSLKSQIGEVVACCLDGYQKATKYMTERFIVRCTARHKARANASSAEFVVTVGKPNYRERIFIKNCLKSGEPFPVKKIQLKEWKSAKRR